MNLLVEDLKAARAIIEDPARWGRNALASNADGEHVFPEDEAAVCFCALGSVRKAVGREQYERYDEATYALSDASRELHGASIVTINDSGEYHAAHAKVLAAFDKAIADNE